MRRSPLQIGLAFLSVVLLFVFVIGALAQTGSQVFMPFIAWQRATEEPPPEPLTEVRAVWLTRFDWTTYGRPASPAKIDEIVSNVAFAGFNTIYFQVRGAADAFYEPGLEPWAQRVSGGQLGQAPDPFWDPLAHMIDKAHARNIQVHAYINVYPVWDNCNAPPPSTTPTHFYHLLDAEYGSENGKLRAVQWTDDDFVHCSGYQRATPASFFVDDHLMAVAADIVTRYDVDGLHLDHIRYGGRTTSCDPVSLARVGVPCFSAPAGFNSYEDWQRAQVNGTVRRYYTDVVPLRPGIWLSAAVWPRYAQGYHDYYQDPKAWVQGNYIDSISPMIYQSSSQSDWYNKVADFQNDRGERYIVPGMHGDYADFSEIATRIEFARQLGTAGHAIFSYGYLEDRLYFDDLAAGPYARPATPPALPWRS